MLNKHNQYFENLHRLGCEYEEKRAAHQDKKQKIIDTFGWDSEELKAWYAEKKAMTFPFPTGVSKAYRAWAESIAKGMDEVEMTDSTWERERRDFVDALRKAGMESFVVTNQSTGLMEDLHGYAELGCTMMGLCTISRRKDRWGEEKEIAIPGIRFSLK